MCKLQSKVNIPNISDSLFYNWQLNENLELNKVLNGINHGYFLEWQNKYVMTLIFLCKGLEAKVYKGILEMGFVSLP